MENNGSNPFSHFHKEKEKEKDKDKDKDKDKGKENIVFLKEWG